MKLTKVSYKQKNIHFEVTKKEFDLLALALGDYLCFTENCLKYKVINPFDRKEEPLILTDKIKQNFQAQARLL